MTEKDNRIAELIEEIDATDNLLAQIAEAIAQGRLIGDISSHASGTLAYIAYTLDTVRKCAE